jgi:hypothetical protein
MDPTLRQRINLLIQLALIDGELDIRERAFIYNVCIRNGVDLDTIGDMIDEPDPIPDLTQLPLPDRIDYITDCLTLTLIDGKVLPKEATFVEGISSQLGFGPEQFNSLVRDISVNVKITAQEIRARVSNIVQADNRPGS